MTTSECGHCTNAQLELLSQMSKGEFEVIKAWAYQLLNMQMWGSSTGILESEIFMSSSSTVVLVAFFEGLFSTLSMLLDNWV